MTCFFQLVKLLEQSSKWPLWTSFCAQSFLGLKWQKDNTSVENLECKSTNTNGSVCTVWFQVSNRLYYSAIICQSEDWGSEIFAYITSQDNFWSIFASCIVLRCGISWNMRKLLLQAILWFEAQCCIILFMNFFALRCSREELELTKVT